MRSLRGKEYGFHLHWGKKHLVRASLQAYAPSTDGTAIVPKTSSKDVGSIVHEDGRPASKLSRRAGMFTRGFSDVRRIWSHFQMSQWKKLEIFNILICSRLTYSLSAFWPRTQCLPSLLLTTYRTYTCRKLLRR